MKKNLIRKLPALLLLLTLTLSLCVCGTSCSRETHPDPTDPSRGLLEGDPGKISSGSTYSGTGLTYYLKLDGIEGDCKDASHEKWIDVIDFSHSAERMSSVDYSLPANRISIVFTHVVDRATPKLQRDCMTKVQISSAEFNAVESVAGAKTVVYKAVFHSLQVVGTSVRTVTNEDGSSCLVEEVTMLAENVTCDLTDSRNYTGTAARNTLFYYVRLDGIEGESNNSNHVKWINATDFSHGAARELPTDRADADGTFEPVVFTHRIDKSTPRLQASCFSGVKIRSGEFHAAKSIAGKETVVYKVSMENIAIAKSVVKTVTDENGLSCLVEEVTLNADKETWLSVSIGIDNTASGTTEASYDQIRKY